MSENYYVGVDLHKLSFDYVTLSSSGSRCKHGHHSTDIGSICDFASSLSNDHHLVVEPVANVHWFLDQVTPYVGSVHLAHSYKVRLIAQSKMKSDSYDARVLADLLRVGYLPEAYRPSPDILSLRRLVMYRISLVRDRARQRNRVLHRLSCVGEQLPFKEKFSKESREYIVTLGIPWDIRYQVDDILSQLDYISSRIEHVEGLLSERGKDYPDLELLRSISGIGPFTGISLIAIVGDITRFRNARAFAKFTGLTPGYRDSGGTQHSVGITHEGSSVLRWLLVQVERHYRYKCKYAANLYNRIKHRSSLQKAKVAVAHRLARVIYHVWTERRPFYTTT